MRGNFSRICDCISAPDIVKFAGELFQDGLISDGGHQAAIAVNATPPANKIALLVSEAMNTVSDSSDDFYKLVSILESRSKKLVSILRHNYSDLQATAASATSPQETRCKMGGSSRYSSHQNSQALDQTSVEAPDHLNAQTSSEDETLIGSAPKRSKQVHRALESCPESDTVKTMAKPRHRLLGSCRIISSTNSPTIYQLPLHFVVKRINFAKAVVKSHVSPHVKLADITATLGVPHKVLMLFGATGAGKSTLINAMANYILGVDWEDEYRFKLISEETTHDQTRSQTKCITAYTFHKDEDSPLPYTLTVIDTPGFGDTGGVERDKEIVKQIKDFFSIRGDEGIDQLHGIGFVTTASQPRLTPTQRYVFDSILSVFGKDVADSIFLMITFSDGKRPPVLDAVRAAGVPFVNNFKFNNSALYASYQTDDEFDKMFWKMGIINFREFFVQFSKAGTQSLILSREVLKKREQLEITIQGLQPQIRAGLAKMDELRQERQLLKDYEVDIIASRDFAYQLQIQVSRQRRINVPKGQYTTNCLKCVFTCHENCPYPRDDDKYKCVAMNNCGSQDATCRVCPGKCSWRDHVCNLYRFEIYQEAETQTSDRLKAKYDSAMSDKDQVENVMMIMKKELKEMDHAVLQKIREAKQCLQRLQEIALKPGHLTEVGYIDLLIESEKREVRSGWSQRVKALNVVRKQAEIVTDIQSTREEKDYFFPQSALEIPHNQAEQQQLGMWRKFKSLW